MKTRFDLITCVYNPQGSLSLQHSFKELEFKHIPSKPKLTKLIKT